MKVAVVLLTKNESAVIGDVILQLKSEASRLNNYKFQFFLWDDSDDQTGQIAEKMGVKVYRGQGRGLGYSYYEAMKCFSEKHQFDILVTLDGDGQVDVAEIGLFLEPLSDGVDMVVGSRFLRASHITYNYPIINRIGVRVLSLLISLGAKKIFTDSHGGFRAMRRELCAGFSFLGTHSYVQETIIDAIARGYRVIEIPSRWNRRQKGESRVVRSPFGYAKKMLIPLVLRSHLHRYIVVFLTMACSGLQWFRLLWFLSVWLVLEGYQLWKFRLNQRLLEVHSDAKL